MNSHVKQTFSDIKERSKKAFFVVLAIVFLGIACIGIVTPGLPTTEFLLLAAGCAAKGSTRLHQWMIQHHLFGPMIRNWQEDRSIHRKTKITAIIMMAVSAVAMYLFVPHPIIVSILASGMALSAFWIWTRPEPAS